MIYTVFVLTFGIYLGQEFPLLPNVKSLFIEYTYKLLANNNNTNFK